MVWLGLLELAIWAVLCFWAVDKLAPWLNDWLVDGINERDEKLKELRAKAKKKRSTNQ